jgi:DNA-binding NarL/FixJ family response regulator
MKTPERIRVVIADDEIAVREAVTAILESENDMEVVGKAADGEQAISLARRLSPQVAVIDVRMPGVDGVEATKQMSVSAPLTRVIALTAFDTDEVALAAIGAGAVGFCSKADVPRTLVPAVRAASRGESLVSPAVLRRLLPLLPTRALGSPPPCSERELQVLALLATGASNEEICQRLFISDATVRSHLYHLRQKLGVRTRAALVVKAFEYGLG